MSGDFDFDLGRRVGEEGRVDDRRSEFDLAGGAQVEAGDFDLVAAFVRSLAGVIEEIEGAATQVNSSAAPVAEVPPGVVTVTCRGPAMQLGAVTLIWVAVSSVIVAALGPKWTASAPERLVPAIVTVSPPPSGPLVGLTAETVGAGTQVYSSAGLVVEVPPAVVTVRWTAPSAQAGAVALIWVAVSSVIVAELDPNSTAVCVFEVGAGDRTVFPPAVGPLLGSIAETLGGEGT